MKAPRDADVKNHHASRRHSADLPHFPLRFVTDLPDTCRPPFVRPYLGPEPRLSGTRSECAMRFISYKGAPPCPS